MRLEMNLNENSLFKKTRVLSRQKHSNEKKEKQVLWVVNENPETCTGNIEDQTAIGKYAVRSQMM